MKFLVINAFHISMLVVLICTDGFSQNTKPDTMIANLYYNKGIDLITKDKFDSALIYIENARKIFEKENLWEGYINCNNSIATTLRQKGQIDSAIELLNNNLILIKREIADDKLIFAKTLIELSLSYRKNGNYTKALSNVLESIEILSQLKIDAVTADAFYLLGMIYSDTGEFSLSLKNLEIALTIINREKTTDPSIGFLLGNIYNGIAYVYQQKGDYKTAIEYYQLTIEAIQNASDKQHPNLAAVYNNLASAYFYLEDNYLALEYYLKALSIDMITKSSDNLSFGYRYNNIAMAYRVNKNFDESLKYSELAHKIFESKLGSFHPNTAGVINNIGRTYSDMGYFNKALELYQKALIIWENNFGNYHHLVAQVYANIGETYGFKAEFPLAIQMLNNSLHIRLQIFGEKHPKIAESYALIGKVYLKMENYDSALYSIQKSIISLTKGFEDSSYCSNPETEEILWFYDMFKTLVLKGDVLILRYYKNNDFNDLYSAYECFVLASGLTDKIRHSFKVEGSKLSFSTKTFSLYEKGIITSLKLFELTGDEKFKNASFIFSEKSKAGVLFDAVSDLRARTFAGIPDTLLEIEKSLRVDLAYFNTQILNEKQKKHPLQEKIKEFEDKYFSLHQQYLSLLENFEKNYFAYYELKYKEEEVSLKLLQGLLATKSVILEYFLSDSALYIFALNNSSLEVKSLAINESLSSTINIFRQALQTLDFENYISSAYLLYKILIEPVKKNISSAENIIVIPDGILNYLPFEALLTKEVSSKNLDFSKLPYLINLFNFSYLPSATFLGDENDSTKTELSFAGFAPVFSDIALSQHKLYNLFDTSLVASNNALKSNDNIIQSLPQSEIEITEIAKLFKMSGLISKVYLYVNANEDNLKSKEISDILCLHLATHGFINDNSPKLSGLLLFNDSSTVEDGILYSEEIFGMNLKAKLVVLSACESGLGKIIDGEGILGLARSFQYAGAENILVSLWQVADKSTSELMIRFYKNILRGSNFSSALSEAKKSLIRDGIYSYPLEWSSFILLGNFSLPRSKGETFENF